MPLASTTVKADAGKLELARLKGINNSKLFRDALDTSLKISGGDKELLESRLAEVTLQMDALELEKRFILDGLKALEKEDTVLQYREDTFDKWKSSIAFQIKNKTITWSTLTKLFRFKNDKECQNWIQAKLSAAATI